MKILSIRPLLTVISLSCVCVLLPSLPVQAATLDSISGPLLPKGRSLIDTDLYFYQLLEKGHHGSASFDVFASEPNFFQLGTNLRLSPLRNMELNLGYTESLPDSFAKQTFNPNTSLYSVQTYDLLSLRDFEGDFRIRSGNAEYYFESLARQHRSLSRFSLGISEPIVFNYTQYHYECMKGGIRYLSQNKTGSTTPSRLEAFGFFALEAGQWYLELSSDYQYGNMRRNSPFTSGRFDHYTQKLQRQMAPEILYRYGLSEQLDILSGLQYTTPFEYQYHYWRYNSNGSYVHVSGEYLWSENLRIPLELNYQASPALHFRLKSPFHWISQNLRDFRDNNGTVTYNASKKLHYFNSQPEITVAFLSRARSDTTPKTSNPFLGPLLEKNQFLLTLRALKDLTFLNKENGNDTLNLIDPYNLFSHATDYFVAGTEEAAFLTGNTTNLAANVKQQNYFQLEGSARYGVTDAIDVLFGMGFHSGSRLHHFVLDESLNRFYTFRPYVYFDFGFWWQLSQNIALTTQAHFVPVYTTYLQRAGDADRFTSTDRYYGITASIRILL